MKTGDNTATEDGGLLSRVGTEGFLSSAFLSNLGAGILAANRGGMPLGAAVGHGLLQANRGQSEALKNQAIRDQLVARQRKTEAQQKLAEQLAAQGQNPELVGLLAQAAPEQLAQGLIGQLFPQATRQNSTLQLLEAAGIDPTSPEGVRLIKEKLEGGASSEMLDGILKGLQIQKLQGDLTTAKDDKDRKTTTGKISTLNSISHLREIASLNARLRGTAGETGLGLNRLRSLAAGPFSALVAALGGDADKARQVAADLGRFEQLTTREAMGSLFSGQVSAGTITDTKLNTFLRTKPGIDQLPETNNKIIADMLQSALDSASVLDFDLPDVDEIRGEIERLRGKPKPTAPPAPAPAPTGAPKNNRSDIPDRELFKRFAEKHPSIGEVTEASVRETMRRFKKTRKEVIAEMRKMVEGD